jgi:hypothetical protein
VEGECGAAVDFAVVVVKVGCGGDMSAAEPHGVSPVHFGGPAEKITGQGWEEGRKVYVCIGGLVVVTSRGMENSERETPATQWGRIGSGAMHSCCCCFFFWDSSGVMVDGERKGGPRAQALCA